MTLSLIQQIVKIVDALGEVTPEMVEIPGYTAKQIARAMQNARFGGQIRTVRTRSAGRWKGRLTNVYGSVRITRHAVSVFDLGRSMGSQP